MKKFGMQLLILATVTMWAAVIMLPDDKLHVIFCDVGQGDATLITYKTQQVLVDTGPDNRVLECLNRHMPFYDRRIEAVIVTHGQRDHDGGARYLTDRYSLVQFEPVLIKGDVLSTGSIKLGTIWPERKVLGLNTLGDENEEGIVNVISWRKFKLLLTADVSDIHYENIKGVTVLKVPHHGSKFAINRERLEEINPALAVISVGKNSYGHPAPEILRMLEDLNINYLRTDKNGEVEIVTDGTSFSVHSNRQPL